MKLAEILEPELVAPDLKAGTQARAFEEMADAMSGKTGIPAATILEALVERESTRPTGMDKGVAIPHARVHGAERFFLLVARSRLGVDFKAEDKSLSKLFFVVVGPDNRPHEYLKILARVARICQGDSFRQRLSSATTAGEMREIVLEEDAKI